MLGVGEQRRAGAVGVVVEVEGDGAGRVVPASVTVALSAIEPPTVAVAGCWLVLIEGVAGVMVTGSARCRW